ncbi:MAG: MG2 domain-containing protein, partial [Polyangiaceae bacterium]|nr:MG2 domain-containing protein [Polyangiaceae bacterium]
MRHALFSPRRLRSLTGRVAVALLASTLPYAGCSSSADTPTDAILDDGDGGDKPTNGTVEIDEASLHATVDGGLLHVRFEARSASAQAASGSLQVLLLSVDNKAQHAQQAAPFAVQPTRTSTVEATLPLPDAVETQQDLVAFNIRVTDGTLNGLRVTRSLLYVLEPYALVLEGPSTSVRDKPANFRVRTLDPVSKRARPGYAVNLQVDDGAGQVANLNGTTGATGDAVFTVDTTRAGTLSITAGTAAHGTTAAVTTSMRVDAPAPRILLTTDKPIYQPGQLMHLRALALQRQGNRPLASAPVTFEIEDGKGNKIFKKARTTDGYGIASTQFRLGTVLNLGTFKVRVDTGGLTTEKTVAVSHYALPKFRIAVQTDKSWYRAGDRLVGSIDADYFFGKPVAGGDVTIEAATLDVGETVFRQVVGRTDADGVFGFTVQLPASLVGLPLERGNALVVLRAKVADTAQQEVTKESLVTVSDSGMDIALVPESTQLVPSMENRLDLFLTDPLGAPLGGIAASVSLPNGTRQAVTTDEYGYASLLWTPPSGFADGTIAVTATAPGGGPVTKSFSFAVQGGHEHVVVRTDKALYETGQTVAIEITTSDASGSVYVDWNNNGQTVDMRTLQAQGGAASFNMTLDSTLIGSNRVEAYVVDSDGNIIRAGRTIFVRGGGSLSVGLATDKPQYAPGEQAQLTFSVHDEQGKPAVAALGVQMVDEAVFGLVEATPGLLRTYFELEDMNSQPHYEIHGPSGDLHEMLFSDPDEPAAEAANQTKAQAALAALGRGSITGVFLESWERVLKQAQTKLSPYLDEERTRLQSLLERSAKVAEDVLRIHGCSPQQYMCEDEPYTQALARLIRDTTVAHDFWGNAYAFANDSYYYELRIVSRGPDELEGTPDDATFVFTNFGESGGKGDPAAQDGAATGGTGGGASGNGGAGGGPGREEGSEPRVRRDFPETLYVNPALITGPDGTATVSIGMADSITEWRVSTLANSADGKLGGGAGGVTVFQDFFVDINFPAQLTRGDEVSFPIAVYNYLDAPQTVQVQLEPGDWYTPMGVTTQAVSLEPGEVRGIRVPVRVDKVGLRTLTVKALGLQKSDAVARTVRVVPDGKQLAQADSGSLQTGSKTHMVSFPAHAVQGSPQLYLNVYPAFLSQAVAGLDSMLQEPYGCFEQTTSTTWPNVLVTRYMLETGQITPEIQMKAESLISTGYQRLLTYEHPGGGFSWFGTQDPAPFLSVTAFGVMEFADMAKAHSIDETLVPRTAQWLASQQKPDGSWQGDQTEFFSFHTSTVRNTAFVTWALGTAGYTGPEVGLGLSYVKANMQTEPTDAYTLGIIANALVFGSPGDAATALVLSNLDAMKTQDGDKAYWDPGDTQTSFYGAGNDATVTTTALVAHAMLQAGGH